MQAITGDCRRRNGKWEKRKNHPYFRSYDILSYPILSSPVLSYPVLSYPVLSCPVLSCPVLSYPILSYPILSYPILSCHARSDLEILPPNLLEPSGGARLDWAGSKLGWETSEQIGRAHV